MSEEKIGRGEKIHIYVSGIVMLLLILFCVGLLITGGVMLGLMD